MSHDPRAVANKLIELGRKKNIHMNHLQLQYLVAMAHGIYLVTYNENLIDEPAETSQWGICFPTLYGAVKRYNVRQQILEYIEHLDFGALYNGEINIYKVESEFNRKEKELLKILVINYGRIPYQTLDNLVNKNEWFLNKEKCLNCDNDKISNTEIKQHFTERLNRSNENEQSEHKKAV